MLTETLAVTAVVDSPVVAAVDSVDVSPSVEFKVVGCIKVELSIEVLVDIASVLFSCAMVVLACVADVVASDGVVLIVVDSVVDIKIQVYDP